MKKIFGLIFMITIGLSTVSCDESLEPTTCTGCDASLPYSHPDASSCYDTKAACDSATGLDCMICT